MQEYKITIETLSDTLLGSGQSGPGTIDIDVRYDEYGMPYMNAKTLKGHLGEQMRFVFSLQSEQFAGVSLSDLLGSPDTEGDKKNGKLHFSAVTLSKGVTATLQKAVRDGSITKEELLDSLTILYSYTSLDEEGIAKDHSLRTVRMLKKGLVFESVLYTEPLNEAEEKLLLYSVKALQHIGTYKSKGKGLVSCQLYKDGKKLSEQDTKGVTANE